MCQETQKKAQDERVRRKPKSSWRLHYERQLNHIGELGLHPKTVGRPWKRFSFLSIFLFIDSRERFVAPFIYAFTGCLYVP